MSARPSRWHFTRREFLGLAAASGAAAVLAACGKTQPTPTPEPTKAQVAPTKAPATVAPTATPAPTAIPANALGVKLPANAAPWDKQVDVSYGEFGPWEHWAEGVYGLGGGSAINYYTQEPLLAFDPYNNLVPVQAESWEANADTTVWTFHLRKGLVWSDGNPITAKDWVFTFQYQADPANGFDFNWYYAPIKGLDKATKSEIKPTEIGVKATDDQTLVFEMEAPTPYWPALVASAFPLPKQAIDKCGKRVWSVKPDCSVASGPYILTRYERDKIAVVSLNQKYKGVAKPVVQHYVFKYSPQKSTDSWALYQNNEIVSVDLSALPANVQQQVKDDTKYKNELFVTPSMGTQYITMDVTRPPFNDVRVRKAFAMAIDRETICRDVLKNTCLPDYSLLPVGFPGYRGDELKALQAYDPDKAKQLLSDAGFAGGKGFPELTYFVRADNPVVPEAIVSMWQKTLGVKLSIEQFDRTNFMQKMAAHNFQIYQLAYYMDYPDAANFLTLFLTSTKRHEWTSAAFDEIMAKSAKEPDAKKRAQLLFDAEKLLLDDAGVVPLNTNIGYALRKPWMTSAGIEAMRKGAPGAGSYTYFLMANQHYTKDAPANWPPVDPKDLK